MYYSIGDKYIDLHFRAKRPWVDFKVFKYKTYTHIVWGKLSLSYGEFSCLERKDTGELADGDFCAECCEHGEYDHGICYNCGKDCTDDLVGQAEAYYEGDR